MQLVYLSPVPWNSVAQRPHFFVKAALKNGFSSILWVEPTPSRLPKLNDLKTKLVSVEADSFEKPVDIRILKLRTLPIEPLGSVYDLVNQKNISRALKSIEEYVLEGDKTILVVGKPSRFAIKVVENFSFTKVVFDVMDDFSKFFSGISASSMERIQLNIIKKADKCFFSSHNLFIKYSELAQGSELVLNACDEEFLKECQAITHCRQRVSSEVKIFGYVGSIAEWFDWECVIKLALDNPDDRVVIVGPNYSNKIPNLPSNIEIRKAVPHCDIPELLKSFDYGLIPFKINELTSSVDPVKYYEYTAARLNIISTDFGEMSYRIKNGFVNSFNNYKTQLPKPETPTTWLTRLSPQFDKLVEKNK